MTTVPWGAIKGPVALLKSEIIRVQPGESGLPRLRLDHHAPGLWSPLFLDASVDSPFAEALKALIEAQSSAQRDDDIGEPDSESCP